MTIRQRSMKLIYPILIGVGKLLNKNGGIYKNEHNVKPITPFFNLSAVAGNGERINFSQYQGKKILIVNTASDCGFTAQLGDLQQLQEMFTKQLVVLAFPSNEFKKQESGSDEEIQTFCSVNYRVSFPIFKKSNVLKVSDQNEVFQWLTDNTKNGWNHTQPAWNFTKYLVNENGVLTHYFDSIISPMDQKVIDAINAI